MNPFLWLLWAVLAIVVLFVAAAVTHAIIEKYRELPAKPSHGQPANVHSASPSTERLTYGEAIDRERHGSQR